MFISKYKDVLIVLDTMQESILFAQNESFEDEERELLSKYYKCLVDTEQAIVECEKALAAKDKEILMLKANDDKYSEAIIRSLRNI
jgi:hypothetical protein